MPKQKYTPRLTQELTLHQHQVLQKHIPHGMQRRFFSVIIDDIVKMFEDHGHLVLVAFMERHLSYREFMQEYANRRLTDSSPEVVVSGRAAIVDSAGAVPTQTETGEEGEGEEEYDGEYA